MSKKKRHSKESEARSETVPPETGVPSGEPIEPPALTEPQAVEASAAASGATDASDQPEATIEGASPNAGLPPKRRAMPFKERIRRAVRAVLGFFALLGKAVAGVFVRVFKAVAEWMPRLVGDVRIHYRAPEWTSRVATRAKDAAAKAKERRAARPKPTGPWTKRAFAALGRAGAFCLKALKGAWPLIKAFFTFKRPLKVWGIARIVILSAGALSLAAAGTFWIISLLPAPPPPDTFTAAVVHPGVDPVSKLPMPFYVLWNRPIARIDLVDKDVSGLVTLDPPIKGAWKWVGDRRLEFSPVDPWPCGFQVKMTMSRELLTDDARPERLDYSFVTAAFSLKVSDFRFYVDPSDPENRRIVATLSSNYPIDPATLDGAISLKVAKGPGKGDSMRFTLDKDAEARKVYLTSERLAVPADTMTVSLEVAEGIRATLGGNVSSAIRGMEVTVPGLYDYVRYEGVDISLIRNERLEWERVLTVRLNVPATPSRVAELVGVYLLPADRKDVAGYQDEKDHRWSLEEVDAALLAKSAKLKLIRLPLATETSDALSFRVTAPSDRMLYVKVAGGKPIVGAFKVRDDLVQLLQVPRAPRSVSIMHSGSLLSLSGEKTISLVGNELTGVAFEVRRMLPDSVNHFITQNVGSLTKPKFRPAFSEDDFTAAYSERRKLSGADSGEAQFFSFDFSRYLTPGIDPKLRYGLFLFKAKGESDANNQGSGHDEGYGYEGGYGDGYVEGGYGEGGYDEGYGYQAPPDPTLAERLILVTDLGLLAKYAADGSVDVFVQNVATGAPVSGARVSVLGRNGLTVTASFTSEDGLARFPSLLGYSADRKPVAFVAKTDLDMSFLPYSDEGRFLDYTRWNTGGTYGEGSPDKLTAFGFSDRGIYRPGETATIAFMVKSGDWSRSVAGLPLEVVVLDSRGSEAWRKPVKLDPSGFFDASFQVGEFAPTGTWEASLFLMREKAEPLQLGSIALRVEEFQPDRLSVRVLVPEGAGRAWLPWAAFKARVEALNLYGLPAEGNEVKLVYHLSPRMPALPGWGGYYFHDPFSASRAYSSNEKTGYSTGGACELTVDPTSFDKGTYVVDIEAEVFEKQGGRSVVALGRVVVSPNELLVGWKPDASLDYVSVGEARAVSLVAVAPSLESKALDGLLLVARERAWVTVLARRENGTFAYESVLKRTTLWEKPYSIRKGGSALALDTSTAGDFEMELVYPDGTVAASFRYQVAGKSALARSMERDAELQLRLDKPRYSPGEAISVSVKAPYVGAGLITIERDKVYAYKWFFTDSESSVQEIVVPDGLEGTAYVCVSFLRSIDSPSIYASPLSYGAVPFEASLDARTIAVRLSAQSQTRSGSKLTVGYSADRPCKVVVYAVDEGILQVARYATPDPLSFYFKKRALEVRTAQILDLLLPEFSLSRELSAMGGGDSGALGSRLNPFKRKDRPPMVFWSGIVDADTAERYVSFPVPTWFNGTVRLMAVAVSQGAVGVTERRTVARNDFIVAPSLPRFVAPGDTVRVGVTVANDAPLKSADGPVKVSIALPKGFTAKSPVDQTLPIPKGAERTVWFEFAAPPDPGATSIRFTAAAEGYSSSIDESISVRPASQYRAVIDSGSLDPGKSVERKIERELAADMRTLELSVGFKPDALLPGVLDYLANYPYGCTEQVISASFPMVASYGGSGVERDKARASWENALRVIQARRNDDGSIGPWSANGDRSPFLDAYVAHYLTVGARVGLKGGERALETSLTFLKRSASESAASRRSLTEASYAVWVMTLNGRVTTALAEDVKVALDTTSSGTWQRRLPGLFLGATYLMLSKKAEAEALLAGFDSEPETDEYWDSKLMRSAVRVFVLASAAPERIAKALDSVEAMAAELEAGRFSTVSGAWAALAFAAYSQAAEAVTATNVLVSEIRADGKEYPIAIGTGDKVTVEYSPLAVQLKIRNAGKTTLRWQLSNSGFDAKPRKEAAIQGIEIFREYLDSNGKPIASARLGEDVLVRIVVRAKAPNKRVNDVVVVDLLPAGFEIPLAAGSRGFSSSVKASTKLKAAEAREDRALFVVDLREDAATIEYSIRASVTGGFVAPSPFAEAMYRRDVWGEGVSGAFLVGE